VWRCDAAVPLALLQIHDHAVLSLMSSTSCCLAPAEHDHQVPNPSAPPLFLASPCEGCEVRVEASRVLKDI
jgi:hypothetical protein